MATIPLTVPESLHAAYLVPCAPDARPLDDLLALALDRPATGDTEQRSIEVARGMAERGLLSVEWVGAPAEILPPFELLATFGAGDAELDALASSPTAIVVVSPGLLMPGTPIHELAARTAAARLAGLVGNGLVVDLFTPRLLPAEALLPDGEDGGPLAMADLLLVPQSAGERGNWLTTKGLGRWGLPELQVIDVPPPVGAVWTSILTGVAAELVRTFTDAVEERTVGDEPPAIVEIDDRLVVTTEIMASAYGAEVDEDDEPVTAAAVQFTFDPSSDPDADDFLTVRAPDDFGRSAGEFHLSVVQDLFGADEGEIRYTDGGDEGMLAAMATARGCLDVARTRFLAGEFQHRTLLLVKYRLEVGDEVEFPWFFVTDWTNDGAMRGSSAVDAEHDPNIRVGRPIGTTIDAVADWGVWADGEGIVEGGWTNAYLQGEPPPPVPTTGSGFEGGGEGDAESGRRWWKRNP